MAALLRVQTTATASGGGHATLTFATPPTVGNAIVIPIALWGNAVPVIAFDNQGNPYSLAAVRVNGSPRVVILYCPKIVVTGSPFTITVYAGGYHGMAAIEVTGLGGGTLQIDQTVTNAGNSTTPSTGTTAALTGADIFSVAVFAIDTGQGASPTIDSASPAWTQEWEVLSFANVPGEGDSRSRSSAAGTTESASWTCSNGASWATALAVFKAAAATTLQPLVSVAAPLGQHGGTSAAIDTTGATLLVVSLATYGGPGTLTDSKGNTWIPLTLRSAGSSRHQFFYAISPSVGAGHTFSVAGSSVWATITVHAFTGAAVTFGAETGNTGTGITSLATGSLTPSDNGTLVVSGFGCSSSGPQTTLAVNVGLAQTNTTLVGGNSVGTTGYLIQGTAAAINPTWSWAASDSVAVGLAVFTPAAPLTGTARLSQLVVETLILPPVPSPARLTQAVFETLYPTPPPPVRLSQAPVETLRQALASVTDARTSQAALEIIYPYGCYEPLPGPPKPRFCPGSLPLDRV